MAGAQVLKPYDGLKTIRPWPVYLLALSVPLSMAATSVAKSLMLLFALVVLATGAVRNAPGIVRPALVSVRVILVMLASLAISLAWVEAPLGEAVLSLSKYAKLLVIPFALVLIANVRQARIALGCYLASQTFVLLTSVMLGFGLKLPWVPVERLSVATVYSTYLDQSIMTAGFAGICWHLRREFPGRHGAYAAVGLALLALANVIFQLPGRTGQLCIIAALAVAIYWGLPARWRRGAIVLPFILVGLAWVVSPQFQTRLSEVISDSKAYVQDGKIMTSAGLRLNLWRSAVEAIRERPVAGHGVGSWGRQFVRLDEGRDLNHKGTGGNPHQEFLLWGVHLGIPGMALLAAFFVALVHDARRMAMPVRRSLLSMIAVLFVACLFNSVLYDALIGDFFCIVLAALFVLGARQPNAEHTAIAS